MRMKECDLARKKIAVVIISILIESVWTIVNVYQSVSLKKTICAGIMVVLALQIFHVIWIKYIGNYNELNKSKNRKLAGLFVGYMYLQCVMGICWACANVFFVPEFGDTAYYLEMSETLQRSSIRSVFYPLLIHICKTIETLTKIDYQFFLYLLQIAVAYGSNLYLIKAVKKCNGNEYKKSEVWIYSLFLTSIPQVMGFHFSVLTDSLACSALVVVTAIGVIWLSKGVLTGKEQVIGMLAVGIGIMLRYERKMLCTVFFIVIALFTISWKKRKQNLQIVKYLVVLCMIPILVTGVINHNTSVRESDVTTHEQSISLRLLAKFGMGNMEDNYDDFPEELKKCISLEVAINLDARTVKPGEVLGMLEDEVGVEKTNEFVNEITYTILKNSSGKWILMIIKDCLLYANPLLFGIIELNGVHVGGIDWNYGRMIMNTPVMSMVYYNFSLYVTTLFLLAFTIYLLWNEKNILKGKFKIWGSMPIMGFLLVSLWGIVNNSLPNDRYVLIIYIFWQLLMLIEAKEVERMTTNRIQGDEVKVSY